MDAPFYNYLDALRRLGGAWCFSEGPSLESRRLCHGRPHARVMRAETEGPSAEAHPSPEALEARTPLTGPVG